MTCSRCQGCLVRGYDELERFDYVYCVNCGARPAQQATMTSHEERDAALLCVECKVRPRERLQEGYARGTQREVARCVGCRVRYNQKRRWAKKRKERQAA